MRFNKKYKLHLITKATDDLRLQLKRIRVEGNKMIATNGTILAVVPIEDNEERLTIDNPLVFNKKVLKREKEIVVEREELKIVSEMYPDWRSVVNDYTGTREPLIHISFNAKELAILAESMGTEMVTLTKMPDKPFKAILVTSCPMDYESKTSEFGLLSPLSKHNMEFPQLYLETLIEQKQEKEDKEKFIERRKEIFSTWQERTTLCGRKVKIIYLTEPEYVLNELQKEFLGVYYSYPNRCYQTTKGHLGDVGQFLIKWKLTCTNCSSNTLSTYIGVKE